MINWRKSSYSDAGTCMNCVQVAVDGAAILVRDSKDPDGPSLRFTSEEWRAFVLGVKDHEFDLPATAG